MYLFYLIRQQQRQQNNLTQKETVSIEHIVATAKNRNNGMRLHIKKTNFNSTDIELHWQRRHWTEQHFYNECLHPLGVFTKSGTLFNVKGDFNCVSVLHHLIANV